MTTPAEAIAEFRDKNHALVRGLCSTDEVEDYRPHLADAARAQPRPAAARAARHLRQAFLQSINLWRLDDHAKVSIEPWG